MKWRWLLGRYIDPGLGLSRAEQVAARNAAMNRLRADAPRWAGLRGTSRRWWMGMSMALIPPAMMLPMLLVVILDLGAGSLGTRITAFMLVFALQIIGTFGVMGVLGGYVIREALAAELRARGYPVCGFCAYRLEGLDATVRCPECGRPTDGSDPA